MDPLRIKTQPSSWRPLFLAGAFCLCLCCGLLGASYALADDPVLMPEAPGSISGVVTDSNGAPLPGIEVLLYQNAYGNWNPLHVMMTAANGTYKAAALGPGIYHLGFRDPKGVYATEYYTDAFTVGSAADVPVAGNDITGINAQLAPGGGISGTVTFTGTPNFNNCSGCTPLHVMHKIAEKWQDVAALALGVPSGIYSVTALPAGLYRVCVTPYNIYYYPSPTLAECYDNLAASVEDAQDVPVIAGEVTPNINFVLGDSADLATLGGQVTSSAGNPLNQIAVTIQPRNGYGLYNTETDSSGHYKMAGLPPGDYIVRFTDAQGHYLDQYYNNTNRPEFADRITLEPKAQRLNVDARLALGGQITGTVTFLQQTSAPNASVIILPALTSPDFGGIGSFYAPVDPLTGAYRSVALPAGKYRVLATANIPPATYLVGYYGGADYEHATQLEVLAGEIKPDIDIDLGKATIFDGSLAGQVTGQGAPQAGIKVSLFYNTTPLTNLFYTYTDIDGHYTINGLADGSYWLGFSDPAGIYATTYYTNQPWSRISLPLSIIDSQAITDANVDLIRGGTISGHVSLRNGKPVADVQIALYDAKTLFFDGPSNMVQTTDSTGNYKIQGLWPGNYRICFIYSTLNTYENNCYGATGINPSLYSAADILVTAGAEVKGIDMVFGSAGPGRLYLPQIAR